MFVIESYSTAVFFCLITMISWGSSSNTQKLVSPDWRIELFCWDYAFGIIVTSLIFALTIGSIGTEGRSFIDDIQQASNENIANALLGGIIFNAANILFITAVSIAGMSVAFSVGSGLSLVIGVVVNYLTSPVGNANLLFLGVFLIIIAILLNTTAYTRMSTAAKSISMKGLLISIASGILMGLFFKYVARSMFLNFKVPVAGKVSPYSAVFIFAVGFFISNIILNTFIMFRPIVGTPVKFSYYLKGTFKNHLLGFIGGSIWCIGMSFSIIASDKAGTAISYGLASGAIVVASIWGIYFWKEFKTAPKGTNVILNAMLISFLLGLVLIVSSR
ncbi:GRP family sugar transporter [Dyadobacter sp. LJ53]|uniref:GRP family sugar transporter n=1 Tax=Dyadobacter chenwenxiniae TaxID=2906456 RepID=UPI001F3FAB43|nr:GRP family sugar transporter [Dyadobacter chenwenxiniae]MCF0053611.1 GRP family sugar transporter [Dyadobacter chenwenxiniae]